MSDKLFFPCEVRMFSDSDSDYDSDSTYENPYSKLSKYEFEHYNVKGLPLHELYGLIYGYLSASKDSDIDLTNWDLSETEELYSLFEGMECLKKVNITGWKPKKLTDIHSMFKGCCFLREIVGFNTLDFSNVVNMSSVFQECNKLKYVDLSGIDTRNVKNMYNLFNECFILKRVNLSGIDTSNVEHMDGMFSECRWLRNIDISGFNTEKVTRMNHMFYECVRLKKVIGIENINTSNVKEMCCMFLGCKRMKKIDVTKWDTRNVEDIYGLFADCETLEEVEGFNKLKLPKIHDAYSVFENCNKLKKIDITCFLTFEGELGYMFNECHELEEIIGFEELSNRFDYSKPWSLSVHFRNCLKLYYRYLLPNVLGFQ